MYEEGSEDVSFELRDLFWELRFRISYWNPSVLNAFACSSPAEAFRSAMMTIAPTSARALAVAAPMPLAAPVIRAVLPLTAV